MQPFDPLNLDARSSLNSTKLADLPGIDATVKGLRALELLSSFAMAEAVRRESEALNLPVTKASPSELLPALDLRLSSPNESVRRTAQRLAGEFGRYLAFLLLTLRRDRADPSTRAYRDHWSTIRTVWLGGGIVSGSLGRAIRDAAHATMGELSLEMSLDVSSYPRHLPLIGAALSVQARTRRALVCDFGGSLAKHGWAHYEDGRLTQIALLPGRPVPEIANVTSQGDYQREVGRMLGGFICDVVEADLRDPDAADEPLRVIACLASYLRNNHPLAYEGVGYPALRHLGANAGDWLAAELSRRFDRPVELTLLHDGTAAARVFAGRPDTAVIMMGTWLGVGFASQKNCAVGLAPEFWIGPNGSTLA